LTVVRSVYGTRLAVPNWLGDVVPGWLAEAMRPKKAPVPWGTMARAVFALWVPMAVAFATGRRELAMLPAMGGLLSVTIDNGGPFWSRVTRIGTAAVCGGAPGLLIGSLIHGRGWIAVGALVFVAGVSSILARLGGIGSVTGLQLFVYSSLGLGPLGGLRPWWHTALLWLAGVVWSLVLITPGYLLSPRSAERKAVAEVFHALANDLRMIGTPGSPGARRALTAALNEAYDGMLTGRAYSSGRSRRDMHLMAVLNVSHQLAEAATALRASGETVPPWVCVTVERLGDAVLDDHGPGTGVLGAGGRRVRRGGPLQGGGGGLPMIPPQWSASPGALALREAMVALAGVISGNWAPLTDAAYGPAPGLWARAGERLERIAEQLVGGRIAWMFTFRLILCTGAAAVLAEVVPLDRSYWLVLTVGIILKPDYGSVFARAVQRGVGTIAGAVLGAAIVVVVPYGPLLLIPFGILAALLPYAKARNFGLVAVFLTPLVVLLIDLLDVAGWRLAEARLIDTVLACAVVLVVGYAPWPSAWQAHLPGQFANALRAVCAYTDEALVTAWGSASGPAESGGPANSGGPAAARKPGAPPAWRSRLRRRTSRALSDLRAEFQRTMAEPTAVSRRATAWWPAVVALEDLVDAVTFTVVAIGRGALSVPPAAAVHQLTGALRTVADAIDTGTPPRTALPLPKEERLEPVTAAVRSVLMVLGTGNAQESADG
jgi:uncharacterized membrane protein YccC